MFNYARSDTHFLLYIYDIMRNELIDQSNFSEPGGNLVDIVMQNSKQESLQRYEKPIYDENYGLGSGGWNEMLQRTPSKFNREQFSAFRAVHQWRDRIAREEDESLSSVLTKRGLYNIAEALPTDVPLLISCVYGSPSKFLLKRKDELLAVIKKGRAGGTTGPDMKDFLEIVSSAAPDSASKGNLNNESFTNFNRREASVAIASKRKGTLPIRSDTSVFWGTTIVKSSPRSDRGLGARLGKLHLAIPLPDLTAEIFVQPKVPSGMANGTRSISALPAEHQPLEKKEPNHGDDVFVIRDSVGAKKRKRGESLSTTLKNNEYPGFEDKGQISNQITLNVGAVGAEDTEKQRAEKKRERTGRRLERKRLRREKALTDEKTSKKQEDEQVKPFDYENAPSVLHVKQTSNGQPKATKKHVNPSAKLLDAPKGMRKAQQEITGKSLTFKK